MISVIDKTALCFQLDATKRNSFKDRSGHKLPPASGEGAIHEITRTNTKMAVFLAAFGVI
jgi:hypothetical protein